MGDVLLNLGAGLSYAFCYVLGLIFVMDVSFCRY